jgi:DNA adenine methylase
MPTNTSPLRYPGGKTRAIKLLDAEIQSRYSGRKTLLSPFFGGGSFELSLYGKGYTIYGNDLFKPLATFWTTIQASCVAVGDAVKARCPVSKENFQEYRRTICELEDPVEIATAYYIVNRCSFSGATFCGGFSQQAASGRLTSSAIKRLLDVKLDNIVFSCIDCIRFLEMHPETDDTLVYADPPYYIETYIYGNHGDMHEAFDHVALSQALKARSDWILCYNDCMYIRNLYAGCEIKKVSWSYGMNAGKESSEIFIFPPK